MLRNKLLMAAVVVGLALGFGRQAQAVEKVKIAGMHMCCPICQRTIYGILKKVDGVTNADVDRTGNSVKFDCPNKEVVENALQALIADGYWGDYRVNSENYDPKVEIIKEGGDKYDKVVFTKVHLCCNACGTSIGNTVEIGNPKGLDAEENDFNRAKGTATFHGEGMDPGELLKLMHKAGFHGVFLAKESEKSE